MKQLPSISLILFSFLFSLFYSQTANDCPGFSDSTWLCQDYKNPLGGACNCNVRSDGFNKIDQGPQCQKTCFCEPSQQNFNTFCSDTTKWQSSADECSEGSIPFMSDWSGSTRIITSEQDTINQMNALSSCEAFGCDNILTANECGAVASEIKTLMELSATDLVQTLSADTNVPHGCFFDKRAHSNPTDTVFQNSLNVNNPSSSSLTASADFDVFCNCNGVQTFTVSGTGPCNAVSSGTYNTQEEAIEACFTLSCTAYGQEVDTNGNPKTRWSIYNDANVIGLSGDGGDDDDAGACFIKNNDFSGADNFQQAKASTPEECGSKVIPNTDTPEDSLSCQAITDTTKCLSAARAFSTPILAFNRDEDANFFSGCVFEDGKFGFRAGTETGVKASTDTQTAICQCPSYEIPPDADCLLENSDPSSGSGDLMITSITTEFSSEETKIHTWFDGSEDTPETADWPNGYDGNLEIEIEFPSMEYNIYALRIVFAKSGHTPQSNSLPKEISLQTSLQSSGNDWTDTNCMNKDFRGPNSRTSGDRGDSFFNFICNAIEQQAKRVKLIMTKPDAAVGIELYSVSFVGAEVTFQPSKTPSSNYPSTSPSLEPSNYPSTSPTVQPSNDPTISNPSTTPSTSPSMAPTTTIIRGKSHCQAAQYSTNLNLLPPETSYADALGQYRIGAFPLLNDFDAEIRTDCSEESYAECQEPWTIISSFRLSVGTGYTGFELWEIDDDDVSWNQITQHATWVEPGSGETITDAEGRTFNVSTDGDCEWDIGNNQRQPCDLLPLTEGSQLYAVRMEVTCNKRRMDRRRRPFVVGWRDGTGVQYVMRPEVNYTLATMAFTDPPVGTDWSFSKLWETFGYAFMSIFIIIFFMCIIFCTSICMESKRTDNYDFLVNTSEFRTDMKQAMRYMPKSVYSDELKPLKEVGQKTKGDESIITTYGVYKGKIRDKSDGTLSYVIDLYSTHTNDIDFYIGQVRLYANENFDPDTKISNTNLSYSCKLDSWELQDTPPSGLRFNSYISKIGIAHDLRETHVSFKRKSFEEVGEYLKQCQQNVNQGNQHGDDDNPFWIEFRDTWKIHPFEYKPMKSRIDTDNVIFWSGGDIEKHCKSVAIREKTHFAGKRHCPYIVIVVMTRIVYMIFFTLTFCFQMFRLINGDQYTTLEDYDRFASERDVQILNMSYTIDEWYNKYNNDPPGYNRVAGDQLLQEANLRNSCLAEFGDMYSAAIDDAMAENTANHNAVMEVNDQRFEFPENEYLATWQASDTTCKLSHTILPDDMEYIVRCEESASLRGITYSECSKRCYQWASDPQQILTSAYVDEDGVSHERTDALYANASLPRKGCTYTTFYYNEENGDQCCDLHLIDDGEPLVTDFSRILDEDYYSSYEQTQSCGLVNGRTSTGTTEIVYDYGNDGNSTTYETRSDDRRTVMSYINVRLCAADDFEITLQGNTMSINQAAGATVAPGSETCNSPTDRGDITLTDTMKIYAYDIPASGATTQAQGGSVVFDAGAVPLTNWWDRTHNEIAPVSVELPEGVIPQGCHFSSWGFQASAAVNLVNYADWEVPQPFLGGSVTFSVADGNTGEDPTGKVLLDWGSVSDRSNPFFDIRLNFQMTCDSCVENSSGDKNCCLSYDEMCRFKKDENLQEDYCFSAEDIFGGTGSGFIDCITHPDNDQSTDYKYECYEMSSMSVDDLYVGPRGNGAEANGGMASQTRDQCFDICSNDETCEVMSWSADNVDADDTLTGMCKTYMNGVRTVLGSPLNNMVFDTTGIVCEKYDAHTQYPTADITCKNIAQVRPYGTEKSGAAGSLEDCELECWNYGASLSDMCYFFTMMGRGNDPDACVLHLGQSFCNEEPLYETVTMNYTAIRQEGSSLTWIRNRTTATIPQFMSADHACDISSLNPSDYYANDLYETIECTAADVTAKRCIEGQDNYYNLITPDRSDIDYYTLLGSNCGSVATPWCVGYSYREATAGYEAGYFRFSQMADPAFDALTTGYCIKHVAAPKFYQPAEMPAVMMQIANSNNEQRDQQIDSMQTNYNDILNALTGSGNMSSGFSLGFNNDQGNEFGFGDPSWDLDLGITDRGLRDGSVEYFMPFNCPGCPSSFDLPDYMDPDSIGEYLTNATTPSPGNYSVSNNVVKPDVQVDFVQIPDLWGWVWDVDMPEFMNFRLFMFVVLTFDGILTIYRVWYTSAIAAQLVRGVDVYVAPKYLRDADVDIVDHKCCDGDSWADMFLSCFLYIHDKIFNMHYYCWRICPYLFLLCNLGMFVVFLIVCYFLISQLIDLDTIDGMGVFSAMTVALGTQKLIRNEVLAYQAFYANNVGAPALTLEINTEIANQLSRQWTYNSDEYNRVQEYNSNLAAAYALFAETRELEGNLYYDMSSGQFPWVSSNFDNRRKLIDSRPDNNGWKPAFDDVEPTGSPSFSPTYEPTLSPATTFSPTTDPTFCPTSSPTSNPSLDPTTETTTTTLTPQPTQGLTGAPTPAATELPSPFDSNGDFVENWTGFQINLRPQYLLGYEDTTSPYWRIKAANVELQYECTPGVYSRYEYEQYGADALQYDIEFLTEVSTNKWEWKSFEMPDWRGKERSWTQTEDSTGTVYQCEYSKSTRNVCPTCSRGYSARPVRAIRVTFPNATQFGDPSVGDLGYYVGEFSVDAYVSQSDIDDVSEYVEWESIYVEPEEYQNKTCPNGVTPIWGYFFRGFSRSYWNRQLRDAHGPYIDALRNIMLSPFVILLVLTCVYIVARLFQFIIEFVLIRADMLRENPYTKIPLVEYSDRWKVDGLQPDHPPENPRCKLLKFPDPYKFVIMEGKRGFHKWKKNDAVNFHIRMYDENKEIVQALQPAEIKNRRYAARITWPRGPGVYWVEVLYHGLPVGPAYELEVLEEGHTSMQNFSKRTSEVWQGVEDDELDIDKLEIDLDQIAKEELDSSDSESSNGEKRGPGHGENSSGANPPVISFQEGSSGTGGTGYASPQEVELQAVAGIDEPDPADPAPAYQAQPQADALAAPGYTDDEFEENANYQDSSGIMYRDEIVQQEEEFPTYSPDANNYQYNNQNTRINTGGYQQAASSEDLIQYGGH